jgi:3-oxoacyl-[acyl-carrier protein] reductase
MEQGQTRQPIALVTGGTKGLGRAVSLELARRGRFVCALYRSDEDAAESLRQELAAQGLHGRADRCDITDPEALDRVLRAEPRIAECGDLVLVNNACAAFEPRPLRLIEWSDFQNQFEVAVKGSLTCAKALLPLMAKAKQGTIINVLSEAIAGDVPKGFGAYAVAKQALKGLTSALSAEYSGLGIRVFSVSPGFMETPLVASWSPHLREAILTGRELQDTARVASSLADLIDR